MTLRKYRTVSGDRCLGSPHSGGMASPYSDYSSGLSPLPTVVADYNRSYDDVNTDGPHLILTEQPQGKFRFRYKSEMVGTHGQLKAERADRNKAIFPTVKLAKWTDGPALIRLMLYTGEDNPSQRRRHVHELSGKNCDKETGMCEVVVDYTTDYTATFQNLGIVHIAKREVKDIISQRKKAELIEHARLRRPHCTPEEIRQSITPTDMKKFDQEAEEIAKTMDLNKVVLRFQAFQYDTSVKCYRPITRSVDSEMVVNLKNASTGELKIVRMSECSAPCTGGTEVWMLVEKVKKNNIKIKFFEMDNDGNEVWSAFGVFSEGDVHHQYAIIFRTPPYRTTNLRSSVRVKVQLERPNDKDISEPRDFTYYPESRKRQSPFPESAKVEEDEDYPQGGGSRSKRLCQGSTEPLDLRFSEFSPAFESDDGPYAQYHDSYPSSSHGPYHGQYQDSFPSTSRGAGRDVARGSNSLDFFEELQHANLFRSPYERQVAMQSNIKRSSSQEGRRAEGGASSAFYNVDPNNPTSPSAGSSMLRRKKFALKGQSSTVTSSDSYQSSYSSESLNSLLDPLTSDSSNSLFKDDSCTPSYSQYPGSLSPQLHPPLTPSPLFGSSSHTSPATSPFSSPYHRTSHDTDYRFLTVPHERRGSRPVSPVNLSHSSQTLNSQHSSLEFETSFLHARSTSTHSVKSTTERDCNIYMNEEYPRLNDSHPDSLPNLWSEGGGNPALQEQPPTYTELRTVKQTVQRSPPALAPLYIPRPAHFDEGSSGPPGSHSASSLLGTPNAPERAAATNSSPTTLTTPVVTVTPPAVSSPLTAIFWTSEQSEHL